MSSSLIVDLASPITGHNPTEKPQSTTPINKQSSTIVQPWFLYPGKRRGRLCRSGWWASDSRDGT